MESQQLLLLGGPVEIVKTEGKSVCEVLRYHNDVTRNEADRGRVLNFYRFPMLVILRDRTVTTLQGSKGTAIAKMQRLTYEQKTWMTEQFGDTNWYAIGSGIWFTNESFRAMFILQWG